MSYPLNGEHQKRAHQIEHFTLHDEGMQAIHDFFNASLEIPLRAEQANELDTRRTSAEEFPYPVDVENVDVRRPKLLERVMHGVVHGLQVVSYVVRLLAGTSTFVKHRVLFMMSGRRVAPQCDVQTLVVITICSRTPRVSIHSPMNISEVSSWLNEVSGAPNLNDTRHTH